MKYLLPNSSDYRELGQAWTRYDEYLQSVADALPKEVLEFATAKWHHDLDDHRCLHDSWVESMIMREHRSDDSASTPSISMELQLLAPFHDGKTFLLYENVVGYHLSLGGASEPLSALHRWHDDWYLDEVRLGERGTVIHEIAFASGAVWLIECRTIRHRTTVGGGMG